LENTPPPRLGNVDRSTMVPLTRRRGLFPEATEEKRQWHKPQV
jgi:hypothetical protein